MMEIQTILLAILATSMFCFGFILIDIKHALQAIAAKPPIQFNNYAENIKIKQGEPE